MFTVYPWVAGKSRASHSTMYVMSLSISFNYVFHFYILSLFWLQKTSLCITFLLNALGSLLLWVEMFWWVCYLLNGINFHHYWFLVVSSSYLCELSMTTQLNHSGYIFPGWLQFFFFDPEFIYVIAYWFVFINMLLASYHKYFYRWREFLLLLCHHKFVK